MAALRLAALLAAALLIVSCTATDAVRIARIASGDPYAAGEMARSKAAHYAANPTALPADIKRFESSLKKLVDAVSGVWGREETRTPEPKQYVKYTQNYLSRAQVDFDRGVVTVETLDTKNPHASLRAAIVTTLLTPRDPRAVDLYSAEPVPLGDTPFLLNEVRDMDGKSIRWGWRAEQFADALLATRLKTRTVNGPNGPVTARYVTIDMVPDHLHIRAAKYRPLVEQYARRFGISPSLVFAVIQVESDFNPFAINSVPAVGLMQVVPTTAGADTYAFLNGRSGTPDKDKLFVPETNILYGTAYLHLISTRYLAGIDDPSKLEYCSISAYNGGAGAVLRTFAQDRDRAMRRINALSVAQVYDKLRSGLPHEETRRYLLKVVGAKRNYVKF